jgi:hypothetical protein
LAATRTSTLDFKFNQITEHDDENVLRVVIIDTEAAHQVWPGQNREEIAVREEIGVSPTTRFVEIIASLLVLQ